MDYPWRWIRPSNPVARVKIFVLQDTAFVCTYEGFAFSAVQPILQQRRGLAWANLVVMQLLQWRVDATGVRKRLLHMPAKYVEIWSSCSDHQMCKMLSLRGHVVRVALFEANRGMGMGQKKPSICP